MKKILVSMCILCMVLGLSACGANDKTKSETDYFSLESKAVATGTPGFTGNAGGLPVADQGSAANTNITKTSQKLIKTVDLSLETLEYDELLLFLDQKIKEFNGYVQESQSYGNSISYSNLRSANVTARVPSDRLEEFIHLIGENTTITIKDENTQDVTHEYVDTESRKKSLEIQQDRLFALLEKADKMEDIIALESRISEVTYQLESYTSTLRTYDNLVDYSTVSIHISEVERVSNPKSEGTWERMKNGLSDSLYSIKEGFKSFSVCFVTSLPYLIMLAVIFFIAVIVVKKARKLYDRKYNYYGPNSSSNSSYNSDANSSESINSTKNDQDKKHLGD